MESSGPYFAPGLRVLHVVLWSAKKDPGLEWLFSGDLTAMRAIFHLRPAWTQWQSLDIPHNCLPLF